MSSNRLQIGIIGVVLDRKMFDNYGDLDGNCIDENNQLFFNYKGTLAYMLIEDEPDPFDFYTFINLGNNIDLKNEFQLRLLNSGIILNTINFNIKFFVNLWYDNSDNPIDMMSIDDFIKS